MARIIVGSYLVRFPFGGYFSWVIQWLSGFQRLGHDVYFVEKSGWANACYDPLKGVMTDDCSYGIARLDELLRRFGLADRWCFVDARERYHGLSQKRIEALFRSADLFVDMGTHGSWLAEATHAGLRVLIDGEPGTRQMRMVSGQEGAKDPEYDVYYTVGQNIGTAKTSAPSAGKDWHHVFFPVQVSDVLETPVRPGAPFTTVMSWQAYAPVEFEGRSYGMKDVEFLEFRGLPRRTSTPLEIAVAGKNVPKTALIREGWRVRNAHEVTKSFDDYWTYIYESGGEFCVCKNVFVETNSGWFGDRSAAYLAAARPVVMQDTGISSHLPCGRGFFAVRTVDEAVTALETVASDPQRHGKWARELALEYLEAEAVLGDFLDELGV
jgi:hypothetical protein